MLKSRTFVLALCLSGSLVGSVPAQAAVPFDLTIAGPADFYPGAAIPAFTGTLSVAGVGVPLQTIELQLDGVVQATGSTDTNGGYSIVLPPIGDTADHVVTAIAFRTTPLEAAASKPLPVRRFPLTVTLTGNGTGSVMSSPPGLSCPGTCTVNLKATTVATLTANPGGGSQFAGWTGDCGGLGACTVSMTGARTVTARFNTNAQIVVSPPFWNIPDLGYTQTAQMTFNVTNVGGSPTGPLSVSITSNDGSFVFLFNGCQGISLGPTQSCGLVVRFTQNSLFGFSNGANLAVSAFPGGFANIRMSGG